MKKILTCLIVILFVFSCNTDKGLGITITGWTAEPNPVNINTDITITLSYTIVLEGMPKRSFYWTYEDDNGDTQVVSTELCHWITLQFSTPGTKTIKCEFIFEDPAFKGDEEMINIEVI